MKLIFEATGAAVVVGAPCTIDGKAYVVDYFKPPHKPASSGKISVRPVGTPEGFGAASEYYVSVIGAKWIEREDRGEGAAS